MDNKNYCRNEESEGPDGSKIFKKFIYCYYGTKDDEFEPCKPRTIDDVRTKCGLIEPFLLSNYEIPISIMNSLRVKRCVSKKQCN